MDLLLLYDFLAARGGAERVLLTLHRHFRADVCVSYADPASFTPNFPPQALMDLGAYNPIPQIRKAQVMWAFATRGRQVASRYATRLYAGSYSVLAAGPELGGRQFYYCHTPPRFLYDLRDRFRYAFPAWKRPLYALLFSWLQPRYEEAVRGMDRVFANSLNVQRRLRHFLGVDATVVYPPVDVDLFRWGHDGDYFLSTARLDPLKRVDRLVEAFRGMPEQQLVVASDGCAARQLRRIAGDARNIRFTGALDDGALASLVGGARATLYIPVDEDFGMSPVESMAAGKPVIGVAEGGLLETIQPGETGLLLPPDPSVEDIRAAVAQMSARRARSMRGACEARAQAFSRQRFLATMADFLA